MSEQMEMFEEKKEEVEKEVPQMDIRSILLGMKDSPTKEKIEEWKALYGEVLVYGFSPTELYIFKPLSREEYVSLQLMTQDKQQKGEVVDLEMETVDVCVLWPRDERYEQLKKKAGTITSLNERIMQDSNFVPSHLAPYLVVKL